MKSLRGLPRSTTKPSPISKRNCRNLKRSWNASKRQEVPHEQPGQIRKIKRADREAQATGPTRCGKDPDCQSSTAEGSRSDSEGEGSARRRRGLGGAGFGIPAAG